MKRFAAIKTGNCSMRLNESAPEGKAMTVTVFRCNDLRLLILALGAGLSAALHPRASGNLEEAPQRARLAEMTGRMYAADPALDRYPAGTTYVYRSARMYTSLSAAFRMNTNILVYTDKELNGKEEALAYLEALGLTDIIDEAFGSVVLVTPIDKARGFGAADQYAYLQLQSAMCNLGFSVQNRDTGARYYADNAYFGGLTNRYLIGLDGGADFICDYVANTLDYVGRIAGMLLVNPSMNEAVDVAAVVPVYLVGGTDTTFARFQAVNGAYAYEKTLDKTVFFNQQFPLRKVVVSGAGGDDPSRYVRDAYYSCYQDHARSGREGGFFVAPTSSANTFNQAPYCCRPAMRSSMESLPTASMSLNTGRTVFRVSGQKRRIPEDLV